MRITIKDCLKLPSFENAKVLTGNENLETIFKRVTVLEEARAEDIDETNIEKNVMVITGFFGVRDDVREQCKMIEKSAHCGMSVLVIHRIGDVLGSVARQVVTLCEKLGVVLIALDENRKIQTYEIIDEVSQLLYYGVDSDFRGTVLTDITFHLLNFDKYESFEQALRAAALEHNFQFILMNSEFTPVLTVETRYITTIDAAISLAKEKAVEKRGAIYTMIDVDGVLTYWGIIVLGNVEYFMFIVDNDDSYSEDEIIKLSRIINMSMAMWKYAPEKDITKEFIRELQRGNMLVANGIKTELGIEDREIKSVYYWQEDLDESARDQWDRYCKKENILSLKMRDIAETYGMLVSKGETIDVAHIYDVVKSNKDMKLFHITGLDGPEDAREGYSLIRETHLAAEKIFPYKRNFSKYDLTMVKNCMSINEGGGVLKRSYVKILKGFNEENSNKGRELLKTLETFVLDANMNGQKTADIMNVHANTIQYRMKKIREIMGVEITANRVIPGITTALAIRRLDKR